MAVMVDKPSQTDSGVKAYLAEHREISTLVRDAQRFSVQLPVLGRVGIPKPRDLAMFGVLGGLAAIGVLEWPAALSLAVGVIVAEKSVSGLRHRNHALVSPRRGPVRIVDGTVSGTTTNLAKRSSRGPTAHRRRILGG